MRKNRFLVTSLAIALAGGYAAAQDAAAPPAKVHTESTTKQTGPGPETKVQTESVRGTVKEYEAGKKIKISGPNDKSYSFDLDEDAKVDGSIIVGQMATVSYVKGSDGREHVAVVSAATRCGRRGYDDGEVGDGDHGQNTRLRAWTTRRSRPKPSSASSSPRGRQEDPS